MIKIKKPIRKRKGHRQRKETDPGPVKESVIGPGLGEEHGLDRDESGRDHASDPGPAIERGRVPETGRDLGRVTENARVHGIERDLVHVTGSVPVPATERGLDPVIERGHAQAVGPRVDPIEILKHLMKGGLVKRAPTCPLLKRRTLLPLKTKLQI